MAFQVPEKYRVKKGPWATTPQDGNNGLFFLPGFRHGDVMQVFASDGEGWEHVSVSMPNRCPTWPEMCRVKELFWSDDDCVVQYHPPKSDWVNNHQYCLHMWRPVGVEVPRPPAMMVGIASLGTLK
jgi:hypothetical protein